MFKVTDNNIEMTEGDYGIVLPMDLELEGTISASDSFKITIYEAIDADPIITKPYNNISDNRIEFSLTEEESKLLKAGKRYYWDLDWYFEKIFLNNIVAKAKLKINEKAGAVNEGQD